MLSEGQEQERREAALFSRVYVPPPAKPAYFDTCVAFAGGRNPYGEPRLRVEWGMDLRTFRNGDPQAIKYPGPWGLGMDRWVLECWRPAEFFGSPQAWEAHRYFNDKNTGMKVDSFGPYPTRGMYTMVIPFVTAPPNEGRYLPCGEDALAFINFNRQLFESRPLNAYTSLEAYARLQEDMEREQEEGWRKAAEESQSIKDYVHAHETELNRNPVHSFPLWPTRKLLRGNQ